MKKIVIPLVVASLALATLACNALTPATPVPLFVPAATEIRPPTATPEPSPTPVPLEVEVVGLAVFAAWEDADQKYDTPAGYAWLAVELQVLVGDPEAAMEGWEREDAFPFILDGDGIELSDGVIVYIPEEDNGKTLVLVFPVPSAASIEGLLLVMPDGTKLPLEEFFQKDPPQQLGPQA